MSQNQTDLTPPAGNWKNAAAEQLVREFDHRHITEKEDHYLIRFGPFTVTKSKNEPGFACDCPYSSIEECQHIIASNHLLDYWEEQKKKERVPTSPPRKAISITHLIRQLSPDDLREVTRTFAQKNRAFSFLLRARFLDEVELEEDTGMYIRLYNDLIHKRAAPASPLSAQDLKIFRIITEAYLHKVRDALIERDFKRGYHILFAVLDRLSLVMYRTSKAAEKLLVLWREVHLMFSELLKMVEAHDLLASIEEDLKTLAGKLYYKYRFFDIHIVHLLLMLDRDMKDEILVDTLASRLMTEEDPEIKRNTLGAALLLAQRLRHQNKIIRELCDHHLELGLHYLQLAGLLIDTDQQALGMTILDLGRKAIGSLYYEQEFIRLLIRYKRPQKEIVDALIQMLREYPSPKIYERLHLTLSQTQADRLVNHVKSIADNDVLLFATFLFISDYEAALRQVHHLALDEVIPLDAPLWHQAPEALASYYFEQLDAYLSVHVGPKAAAYTQGILRHINKRLSIGKILQILKTKDCDERLYSYAKML